MGTRIEDTDGNLLWAPNDFGKYSIEKVQAVSDIISELLGDITITVKPDGEALSTTYTKEQILELLKAYMLKADFEEMAGQAVKDKTDIYIKELQDAGRIVTTDTTDIIDGHVSDVKTVVNYLTTLCFDSSFASVLGWETEPSIQPLPPRLDNIDTQIIDISSRVDAVIRDVYLDPQLREGFKFATTQQLETATDDLSGLVDRVGAVESDIDGLTTRVGNLESADTAQDTKNQQFESSINSVTSSVGDLSTLDASLGSGSLVAALNNLATVVNGLSQKIQSIEDRITQLENNP